MIKSWVMVFDDGRLRLYKVDPKEVEPLIAGHKKRGRSPKTLAARVHEYVSTHENTSLREIMQNMKITREQFDAVKAEAEVELFTKLRADGRLGAAAVITREEMTKRMSALKRTP